MQGANILFGGDPVTWPEIFAGAMQIGNCADTIGRGVQLVYCELNSWRNVQLVLLSSAGKFNVSVSVNEHRNIGPVKTVDRNVYALFVGIVFGVDSPNSGRIRMETNYMYRRGALV